MRKINVIATVLFVLFAGGLSAQNCVSWYPTETSARWEMMNYDAKSKLTGVNVSKVLSKEMTASGMTVTIEAESFDGKYASQGKNTYTVGCSNGKFYMSLDNLVNKSMYKDMEVSVTADQLELPSALTVGMSLPDGQVAMSASTQGIPVMNLTIKLSNRKVQAIENITTTAGTFECYKITYDITTVSFVNVTTKSIEWYCKETGVVRSETYDAGGKMLGYSVLSKFSK